MNANVLSSGDEDSRENTLFATELMETLSDFTTLVNPERRARLLKLKSFHEVISGLQPTIKIIDYSPDVFLGNRLRGCKRASFLLSVERDAGDAFFNSPVGYRAQHCRGRETGEGANRQILNALQEALIEFAKPRMRPLLAWYS